MSDPSERKKKTTTTTKKGQRDSLNDFVEVFSPAADKN